MQQLQESSAALASASRYCSLVSVALTVEEELTAGAEAIGAASDNVASAVLLDLRLRDIASATCTSALRDVEVSSGLAAARIPHLKY